MSRRLLILVLALSLLHAGCQSPRRVPPAHGVDAGLVEERRIDRKALLDWCEQEPMARYGMYALGLTLIGLAVTAIIVLELLDDEHDLIQ